MKGIDSPFSCISLVSISVPFTVETRPFCVLFLCFYSKIILINTAAKNRVDGEAVEELRAQREITRPNEAKAAMDFEVLFQPKANGLNGAFLFSFSFLGCWLD